MSAPTPAPTTVSFGPWAAGYLSYAPPGQAFTATEAEFVVPTATPTVAGTPPGATVNAWVSLWTGIGLSPGPGQQLMQAGVSLRDHGGAWDLVAPWWINEPSAPTRPHSLPLTLHPGDLVRVDVALTDAQTHTWRFTVTDVTNEKAATGQCTGCLGVQNSAGWMMEDPSSGSAYTPFADPGPMTFLSAKAALDGGPLEPLAATVAHPVIRRVAGQVGQGPSGVGPNAQGGFVLTAITPDPASSS